LLEALEVRAPQFIANTLSILPVASLRPGSVVAPVQDARRIPPSTDARLSGLIRQDLFDRNNPNNLRSDWPSPPAQPGPFQ
jgi:hypothetical protein